MARVDPQHGNVDRRQGFRRRAGRSRRRPARPGSRCRPTGSTSSSKSSASADHASTDFDRHQSSARSRSWTVSFRVGLKAKPSRVIRQRPGAAGTRGCRRARAAATRSRRQTAGPTPPRARARASTVARRTAGSLTTPFGTASRPASNCGLTKATISPSGRQLGLHPAQDPRQRDERDVDYGQADSLRQSQRILMVWIEPAGVRPLHRNHAGVTTQRLGKLSASHVESIDARSTALQQDIGEAAGRRPDVEADRDRPDRSQRHRARRPTFRRHARRSAVVRPAPLPFPPRQRRLVCDRVWPDRHVPTITWPASSSACAFERVSARPRSTSSWSSRSFSFGWSAVRRCGPRSRRAKASARESRSPRESGP